MRGRLNSMLWYAAGFATAAALFALLLAWGGVYPFGPESFLTEDLKYQYIDFFTWYRSVLLGEESLFYTFGTSLGSDTWALFSYYLASPFNLLVVFFDEQHLTEFALLVTVLKIGCIQMSTMWFLRRRFKLRHGWALALALCFSWSLWMATQLRNPIWLDAFILLPPMLALGHEYIRSGAWRTLLVLMCLDVIICWYMAYMTILFLSLSLVAEMVLFVLGEGQVGARYVVRRVLGYLGICALALLLSAFTFVPTVVQMMGAEPSKPLVGLVTCHAGALLSGLSFGSWALDRSPQVGVASLVSILAVAFLVSRSHCGKEKWAVLALPLVALAGTTSTVLQYVWCGFRVPSGFYSRMAVFFVLSCIWMAGFAAKDLQEKRLETRALVAGGAVALALPAIALAAGRYSDLRVAVLGMAIAAAVAVLLVVYLKATSPLRAGTALLLAVLVVCAELTVNDHLAWSQLYTGYPQQLHERYLEDSANQLEALQAYDGSVYRYDKTFTRTGAAFNEGLAQGYRALSSYTSAHDRHAVDFLAGIGYSNPGELSAVYTSPVLLMDSLLGLKYVSMSAEHQGYEAVDGIPAIRGARTYCDPFALSLGYQVSADIANFDMEAAGDNPFERQNALVSALLGRQVELYRPLEATELDSSAGSRSWHVASAEGAIAYVYVGSAAAGNNGTPAVTLAVDGQDPVAENWRFGHAIRELAGAGEHDVTISASSPDDAGSALPVGCSFYYLDLDAFESAMAELSQTQVQVTQADHATFTGDVSLDQVGTVLLTIPSGKGWNVQVNGTESPAGSVCGGAFTLLELPAGSSHIEMHYTSPGLYAGCAISTATLVLLGVFALVRHRRRSGATDKRG